MNNDYNNNFDDAFELLDYNKQKLFIESIPVILNVDFASKIKLNSLIKEFLSNHSETSRNVKVREILDVLSKSKMKFSHSAFYEVFDRTNISNIDLCEKFEKNPISYIEKFIKIYRLTTDVKDAEKEKQTSMRKRNKKSYAKSNKNLPLSRGESYDTTNHSPVNANHTYYNTDYDDDYSFKLSDFTDFIKSLDIDLSNRKTIINLARKIRNANVKLLRDHYTGKLIKEINSLGSDIHVIDEYMLSSYLIEKRQNHSDDRLLKILLDYFIKKVRGEMVVENNKIYDELDAQTRGQEDFDESWLEDGYEEPVISAINSALGDLNVPSKQQVETKGIEKPPTYKSTDLYGLDSETKVLQPAIKNQDLPIEQIQTKMLRMIDSSKPIDVTWDSEETLAIKVGNEEHTHMLPKTALRMYEGNYAFYQEFKNCVGEEETKALLIELEKDEPKIEEDAKIADIIVGDKIDITHVLNIINRIYLNAPNDLYSTKRDSSYIKLLSIYDVLYERVILYYDSLSTDEKKSFVDNVKTTLHPDLLQMDMIIPTPNMLKAKINAKIIELMLENNNQVEYDKVDYNYRVEESISFATQYMPLEQIATLYFYIRSTINSYDNLQNKDEIYDYRKNGKEINSILQGLEENYAKAIYLKYNDKFIRLLEKGMSYDEILSIIKDEYLNGRKLQECKLYGQEMDYNIDHLINQIIRKLSI